MASQTKIPFLWSSPIAGVAPVRGTGTPIFIGSTSVGGAVGDTGGAVGDTGAGAQESKINAAAKATVPIKMRTLFPFINFSFPFIFLVPLSYAEILNFSTASPPSTRHLLEVLAI
jgi:hypothetical protein